MDVGRRLDDPLEGVHELGDYDIRRTGHGADGRGSHTGSADGHGGLGDCQ